MAARWVSPPIHRWEIVVLVAFWDWRPSYFFALALAVGVLTTLAVYRIHEYAVGPRATLLTGVGEGGWIKVDRPPSPLAKLRGVETARFRYTFELADPPHHADLLIKAFRSYALDVNGERVTPHPRNPVPWTKSARHEIGLALRKGRNEIVVTVENDLGPPAMAASCALLGIATGVHWSADAIQPSGVSSQRQDLRVVSVALKRPFAVSQHFPTASESLLRARYPLLAFFLVGFTGALAFHKARALIGRGWRPRADQLRWAICGAWIVLCIHNIAELPTYVGADVNHHYDYIRYVANRRHIPLAPQGLEMHQAPLYYLLSAPLWLLFSQLLSADAALAALRVLPMACGLAQIEIAFRSCRVVFPEREDLQGLGTLVGGLLPMNLYLSQVVGNETLSGALTAALLYACFRWSAEPARGSLTARSRALGGLWGLALLTKVTAAILLPVVGVLIVVIARLRRAHWREAGVAVCGFASVGAMVSGWYYVRNWLKLGRPFVVSWSGVWWQDPGYRVPEDLLSFGQVLIQPVYASLFGFWDGLYSSFWLDGNLSSVMNERFLPPWNYDFLLSMALLSLPMTLLGGLGALRALRLPRDGSDRVRLFAVCCLAVYLAALLDYFLTLPAYAAAKSAFALGLIPGYAVLIASGFEVVARGLILRSLAWGYALTWALTGYLAYFVERSG